MAKGKVYITEYPDDPPEWYWINGLHDACIIGTEEYEFPFDYDRFTGKKNHHVRNLLTLQINAKGAMFDQKVTEIRFFNYKILTDGVLPDGGKKVWWLADRLVDYGNGYSLEIKLQDPDSYPEDFTLGLRFEWAEVDRK